MTDYGGFTGSVSLSALNLPSGVTASFGTNPASGTSSLMLTASSSAPPGSYTVMVSGAYNILTATAAVPLTISGSGPVISGVAATNVSGTSATITWTTNQASSSQVKYGTTAAYGSTSTLSSSLVTSHSVTLTGLTPGTTYNYAVLSANSAGTLATSANFTFATTASIGGAITVTGNMCANWTYSTSTSCNWTPNSPSAGNSIHCFVFNFSTTGGFSVTDNAVTPNAYTQNGSTYIGTANGGHYALFDDLSITDGSLTRTTVNLSGSGSFFGLSCYETRREDQKS